MILTHFKQAWQLLRQNKLFSTIYIVGTALAIASTTIFALIYYIRLAPVYPEYKRNQIYSASFVTQTNKDNNKYSSPSFSYDIMNKLFYNLENAEVVSGYIEEPGLQLIHIPNQEKYYEIIKRSSDPAYFKILDFEFLAGAPFTQADFDAGVHKLVISDRAAEKMFSSPEEAIGKTVSLDFSDYEVCGVFREGSAINQFSFVQAIAPYTAGKLYKQAYSPIEGWLSAIILTDNPDGVKAEMDDFCRRFAAENDLLEINFLNQPYSATFRALAASPYEEIDIMAILRFNLLILLTLLIVPALNLSGMIAGRMDIRHNELSIRKSFGATRGRLLSQVLWENLFLTIIGGIFGLVLTWLILSSDAVAIFANIGSQRQYMNSAIDIRLTTDMLFAPAVFVFAFLVCVILNILSALIPAWSALRKPIVKSLK